MRSEALPDIHPSPISCPDTRRAAGSGSVRQRTPPAEIVERPNKEINAGLADPKIKARYAELGTTALAGSPANFDKFIADEPKNGPR